jgi:hypothetical protein
VPLLLTAPRIGWVLAFGIAAEVGDIARFASDILGTTHTHFGAGRSVGLGQRAAPLVDGEPQSVAVAWVSVLRAHFAVADRDPASPQAESAQAIAPARELGSGWRRACGRCGLRRTGASIRRSWLDGPGAHGPDRLLDR